MSGVVALVAGLVDTAATLTQFRVTPPGIDQKQFHDLAATVAGIRTDLMNRRIPASIQFHPHDEPSDAVPLLREMENIVTLIPQAFAGSRSIDEYQPASDDIPGPKLLVPARSLVANTLDSRSMAALRRACVTSSTIPSPGRVSARQSLRAC